MIQVLALLAMVNLLASSCINSVFTVFTVTNRIKIPALMTLANGVFTVIINFVLLKTTNLGVYAIAGTSSILGLLRNYIFTPLYGAHCLGVKKSTFYKEIITGNICLVINLGIGVLFYRMISAGTTWISLILAAGSMAVVCIGVNFGIVLNREEKKVFINAITSRLMRKGE